VVTCRNSRSMHAHRKSCPARAAFSGLSIMPRFTISTPGPALRSATLLALFQALFQTRELRPVRVEPDGKQPYPQSGILVIARHGPPVHRVARLLYGDLR
jgi:hypothetical protein